MNFNTSNWPCSLSAVVHQGHGFLDFNCLAIGAQGAIGFYPASILESVQNTNKDLFEQNVLQHVWGNSIAIGKLHINEATTHNSFGLQATTTIQRAITQEILPNTLVSASYYNDNSLKNIISSVYYYFFPATSIPVEYGIGTTGTAGSTSGLRSLFFPEKGMILNERDRGSFYNCRYQIPSPCVKVTLSLSPEEVHKAWSFAKKTKDAIWEMSEQCPSNSIFRQNDPYISFPDDHSTQDIKTEYKAIGYNCIDFMRRSLHETGRGADYEERLQWKIAQEPTWKKLQSIAWQYFRWTRD